MGRIFKSFIFDGKKSKDFNIYVSGTGVYDAPERDVDLVEIPGRDGALVIDNGRYKNITVTYPASAHDVTQADFSQKIEALRNFLTSRIGYKRLEDEYNLDEFRMGIYKSGLQVDPSLHGKAGEFSLVFDCKPQRFLKSGEAPTEFTADGKIYNPTYYESSPLLEVEGRGEVVLNGYPIEINVDPLGELSLFNAVTGQFQVGAVFADVPFTSGDDIAVKNSAWSITYRPPAGGYILDATIANLSGVTAQASIANGGQAVIVSIAKNAADFIEGQSLTVTGSLRLFVDGKKADSTNFTDTIDITVSIYYNGTKTISATYNTSGVNNVIYSTDSVKLGDGFIDSTVTSLGETLYIDCELGEAYTANGQSWNNAVSLGADLPKLSPGDNTVTLANTIDALRIIPRWFRL